MKKSVIVISFLILGILFASPVSVSAETKAGIKPGSFFYFFDTTFEKINLFFTFNPEKKAQKNLEYADERLAEAEAVAQEKNTDAVKTAVAGYESNIALAAEESSQIKDKGKTEELLNSIADNTSKHQEILAEVLNKVPDEAKDAIIKAIEVSRKGQEEALKQIADLKGEVEQLKKEVAELKQNDKENQSDEIEKLKKEIEELKKKPSSIPAPVVSAPKSTSPIPTTTDNNAPSITPPQVENWSELESKYFTEANQKGWTNLIITNSAGEKRYYRKEENQWVRKNSEAEIQQPYITPPTTDQLVRLIRMCAADPEIQAICDRPEFMPGYYSNLTFRNGIDAQVLRYENFVFNQQNRNANSVYILPPLQLPSYITPNYSLPSYTPPATYYTPPTTYTSPTTGRVEFSRDPRTGRIYSSSNGNNYFYDLNGRLDHVVGPSGIMQLNYGLNGNLDSIDY